MASSTVIEEADKVKVLHIPVTLSYPADVEIQDSLDAVPVEQSFLLHSPVYTIGPVLLSLAAGIEVAIDRAFVDKVVISVNLRD